jgi:alcohol dehydrogenase/propanol-preferring alcohol dehydrogenase
MPKMRAVQVSRKGGPLELVEREIPQPGPGTVRIKVEACGVCHSDSLLVQGGLPGQEFPRIPGHEVVGVVDQPGPGVTAFARGDRVGVGWHGGMDFTCDACRRGDFFACRLNLVTGFTSDGGYAEYMVARTDALARFPAGLKPGDAAPLLCAGVTTFNAIRNAGARAGGLVAVLGVGGLGHLAIQYAAKMGFRTVAIARGKEREALSRKLGASGYIDSETQDPAAELTKLGGADTVVATAPSGKAMAALIPGLAPNGSLLVIGASADPIEVNGLLLLTGRRNVLGWYSGTAIDSQDTLAFSLATGVASMNETFPLERAQEAYDRMMNGKARFRSVLSFA